MFLGHKGPTCRDIPDPGPGMSRTKTLCKAPISVVLDRGAGMSRNLGRDVQGSEKLYSRKLWADVSFPKLCRVFNKMEITPCREGWNLHAVVVLQCEALFWRRFAGQDWPPKSRCKMAFFGADLLFSEAISSCKTGVLRGFAPARDAKSGFEARLAQKTLQSEPRLLTVRGEGHSLGQKLRNGPQTPKRSRKWLSPPEKEAQKVHLREVLKALALGTCTPTLASSQGALANKFSEAITAAKRLFG